MQRGKAQVCVLPIERIAHLYDNKHGQCRCLRFGVIEDITVDAGKHSWLGRTLHVVSLNTAR